MPDKCANVVKSCLPCNEDPLRNFSQEFCEFISINHTFVFPQINRWWTDTDCVKHCETSPGGTGTSVDGFCAPGFDQFSSDDCARRLAEVCVWNPPGCESGCGGEPPNPPQPPRTIYVSGPQLGIFVCPDGSIYYFPLEAGAFQSINNQAEADTIAASVAKARAESFHFCLPIPSICPCVGIPSKTFLAIIDGQGPFSWNVVGSLPLGFDLEIIGDREAKIQGTGSTPGVFSFALKIFDGVGGYLTTQPFIVHILQIASTTLPDFETGVPYSYQLTGIGGSGNYAWKIVAGSLPTGLSINVVGKITGTPTSDISASFSVAMIDLDCQNIDRSFFPPKVKLVGHSTTTIATVRGYDEFGSPSSPPKKYMVRTYTTGMTGNDAAGNPALADEGVSLFLFADSSPPTQLAYAMSQLSGHDEINLAGQTISTAITRLSSSCPDSNVQPIVIYFAEPLPYSQTIMPGWCFQYDTSFSYTERPSPTPVPCGCNYPLLPDNTSPPLNLYAAHAIVISPTHAQNFNEGTSILGFMANPIFMPIPPNLGYPFLSSFVGHMAYKHNYQIDLSVEYTDAMALANAVVYHSNGLVAQSKPRTTGFISTWTTVVFDLNFTNLLAGESYLATVDFVNDNFTKVTKSYNFTASGTTHTITDSIPVPANGKTIEAKHPTAAFAF